MIEVTYPPGAQDVAHRHDAHAFVYVLEGQIVMQLKGQPAVTLKAGQTFYEGPNDVHVVGRNASNTEPARFVVVLLKGKGAPVLTPVKESCSALYASWSFGPSSSQGLWSKPCRQLRWRAGVCRGPVQPGPFLQSGTCKIGACFHSGRFAASVSTRPDNHLRARSRAA